MAGQACGSHERKESLAHRGAIDALRAEVGDVCLLLVAQTAELVLAIRAWCSEGLYRRVKKGQGGKERVSLWKRRGRSLERENEGAGGSRRRRKAKTR